MGQTLSEKILCRASGKDKVKSGDFVISQVDLAMIPDLTTILSFDAMKSSGAEKVWDPDRLVLFLDHVAPPSSIRSAEIHKDVRNFTSEQDIKWLYDVEYGVCHQVLADQGHVKPGMLIVGADSHTCTHGAFGAFATGVGSTDIGGILATGKIWLKVPESIKVILEGKLPKYVYPKDVILTLCGKIGAYGATYKALEFHGSTVRNMSMAGRMTLCNMAIEMGGKTGIIEPDNTTHSYLKERVETDYTPVFADEDAGYEREIEINSENLEPVVSCPHQVDNIKAVSELDKVEIDQVFIGSCTNGRLEDLQVAYEILKGRKVHPDTRLIVVPASQDVYLDALDRGIIRGLIESGTVVSNPSCGACFGGHIGIMASGETGITTSNRNFKGRQGSPRSNLYLSSPAVAAATSLMGYITHPEEVE